MKTFLLFGLLLLFINFSYSQTNYYVDNTLGNDVPGNGLSTGSGAWKTIEYAVDNVSNPSSEQIIINITSGTYDLSNNQIDINRNFLDLTLIGEGVNNTIIESASDTSLSTSRILEIYSNNNVTLKSITIQNGRMNNGGDGFIHGGGIFNKYGNLTVENCKIANNVTGINGTGYGVGICNLRGTMNISNSTITQNVGFVSSTNPQYGGGVASIDGKMTISNSTISFNSSPSSGGIAILSTDGDTVKSVFEIENSTISENQAYNSYGGVRISRWGPTNSKSIEASFNSCTVFKNYADSSVGGVGFTSELVTSGVQANIKNSIFAGNNSTANIDLSFWNGIGVITSDGYNIIQKYSGQAISGQTNNGIGLDPLLQALADNNTNNGTQTCALSVGSPAIDAIPGGNGAPLFDQRGYQRVGDYDIGAFELSNLSDIQLLNSTPSSLLLAQNFPNPFNPITKIQYVIPSLDISGNNKIFVILKVYDLLGNEVCTLVNEEKYEGAYEVEFNSENLTSGVYIYRIQSQKFNVSRKMILLK